MLRMRNVSNGKFKMSRRKGLTCELLGRQRSIMRASSFPTTAVPGREGRTGYTAGYASGGVAVAPLPSSPSQQLPPRRTTVLVVVNVLPVLFERTADDSAWRIEWNSTATAMFYRTLVGDSGRYEPLFVGCPEVFVPKEEEAAVEKQLEAFRCVPVFLDPTVAHNYFQGFCKGMLWPIFHNVVDVYNSAPLTLDEVDAPLCSEQQQQKAEEKMKKEKEKRKRLKSQRSSSGEFVSQSCWCDPASWNPAAQDTCWSDYCSVNRTFARRVVENYHDGDLIWIQDFYFLMMPSYLLRRLRNALVTLYLHVPFPSSEVFRCLAMRTEIIRAMLCADHIGFLLFEHARHFLTSCKRMLGLNYKTNPNGMLVMEYNGREIFVSCSHVEPDLTHMFQILENKHDGNSRALEFRNGIEQFIYTTDSDGSRRHKKLVISSADRLEGLTGLPLKLRAFDRFLALHPELRKSVVLIQIGLTLDSRPNDYKQTRDYVIRFSEEINRRWGTPDEPLVVFQEKAKTTCAERMQLWQMTDIYLDTCVRGGLWLFPFEFMVVQKRHEELDAHRFVDRERHEYGVMIASEFASYSRVLNGCLSVNPWKTEDMVSALTKAIEMTSYEKQSRFRLSYKFLEGPSASKRWGERLLQDLESTITKQNRADEREVIEVGFGFDFRVVQFESGFAKLDVDDLVKKYSKSTRRLFIFDYGGTLSSTSSIFDEDCPPSLDSPLGGSFVNVKELRDDFFGDPPEQRIRFIDGHIRSPISRDLRDNLAELCGDRRNIVFVVSTGHRGEVEREFGTIPHVNLIADNGLFVKLAQNSGWECLCENELHLFDWKHDVKQVMVAYAGRTNGAYILESEASLVYDYRNSDPEYGEIQSLELYEQLRRVVKVCEAMLARTIRLTNC